MRILLTGFTPFDGQPVNASQLAVEAVAARWAAEGTDDELHVRLLPVSFVRARRELRAAVAEVAPGLVVCVGEAGGRGRVGLERVALNVMDARIPDDDGHRPVDVAVVSGAPVAFLSSLPVKACAVAVERTGVPVEVSNTAGTYVCNATAYALAHLLASRLPDVRGGFVHVPRTPGQVDAVAPAMSTDDAATALVAILATAARVTHDEPTPAGALD